MTSDEQTTSQERRSFIEAARRAQIVEAAVNTIAELGYHQASLAQVAKQAGISTGLISYHFKGKDDLMMQIVVEVYAAGSKFMVPRLEAETTATRLLRIYIESNLAFIATYPKYAVVLREIFTNFRTADGKPHFDETTEEPIIASLEWILRKGQTEGEFRDFDTRIMAVTIRRAIDGAVGQKTAYPNLDLIGYSRELATLFDLATRKPRSNIRRK